MPSPDLNSEEFIRFCQVLRPGGNEAGRFAQRIANHASDWSKIIEGAHRHRVESQLLAGLRDLDELPPEFVQNLRKAAKEAARASLMQIRETGRLAGLFRQANIPLIALKGVALSVQLGRDPTQRNSRDIDFLIPGNCVAQASLIMRGAGYEVQGLNVPDMTPSYLRWNKEVKYFHPGNRTLVELHYRLVDNAELLNYEFDELWEERENVNVGGVEIAVMPRCHLILFLCVHGAAHAWERLCWLIDFASALPTEKSVEEAIQLATSKGIRAIMLHAILLAHRWLGCAVAEENLALARDCPRIARLDRLLARSYGPSTWYCAPSRDSFSGFLRYSIWLRLYVYSLKPGWRYRKSQLARELLAPADWDTFQLPPTLSWAYPLLRPIGWIVRRLTGGA